MSEAIDRAEELDDLVSELLTPRLGRGAASSVTWDAFGMLPTAGGEVAVWRSGAGPAVLLVHGWASTHADMDAFVAPLRERGFEAVTLDLPAHGASEGAMATMPEVAAAIAGVAAAYGPPAGIIAHSFGCPASAMAIAAGMRVPRMVLVAPPAHYEMFVRATAARAGVDLDALMAAFAARGVDVPSLDLPRTAAALDVPALIFHSADDRIVDVRFGEEVAAAWPGSTFVRLQGLGHSRILRDPEVVRRAADFIAGATPQ